MLSFRLILACNVKDLSQHATPTQILEISKKRDRLQSRIDAFHSKASSYLVDVDLHLAESEWVTDDDSDDIADPDGIVPVPPVTNISVSDKVETEKLPVMLPSTVGLQHCACANLKDMVNKEISLRQGQANDALQALRLAIGKKSFLFRTRLRAAKSKVEKLRSWRDIGAITANVQHQAKIYRKARKALVALGASEDIMSKYLVLKADHLRSCTVIVNPNAPGERQTSLAWFWSLDIAGDSLDNELMQECECLHFIVANNASD
jgi:hypothetical protein